MNPQRTGPLPSERGSELMTSSIWTRERQQQVEEVLDGFFAAGKRRARDLAPGYKVLWKVLEKGAVGGKRFRPRMVMTAYLGLGGTQPEFAAQVGAAYELLHTAFVIHDDVIDRDFVRRGVPNVAGSYRERAHTAGIPLPAAEHRGMSVGVVAGDLVLAAAFRLIARVSVPEPVKQRLFDLVEEAVFSSAAGELMDVEFSLGAPSVTVHDILRMEKFKTAVYSFECPLQSGAVLAGASEPTVELLGALGENIGIAYQLVDDILGVFGDAQSTGKSTLGDLREGKKTVLIALAEATAEWASVASLFGSADLDEEGAERIRSVLISSGARGRTEALVRDFTARVRVQLDSDLVPDRLRAELVPLVELLAHRVA